jgi:dTMP kinase
MTIVADRYAFSGIAFSAAKVGHPASFLMLMQGLPFDYCLNPDQGLPLPDLVINLSLSPEEAAKRGQYGEERYESIDMQQRTRQQFRLVADQMESRHPGRWAEVDAAGSVEEVAERIWETVLHVQAGDLGKLWE